MNEKEKKDYLERYKQEKEKGVPFFPDIIFKDAVVSLIVFVILIGLAYFVGIPTEGRADPNDTLYTPRPEWYFLFLFQLLKYFPGQLEFIGAMLIPGAFVLLLLALPFLDRNPKRHVFNRPLAGVAALAVVGGIVALSTLSVLEAPPPQVEEQVDRAAALYAENCANCHGPAITVPPATDLHQLIAEGRHEGMPAWGADLSTDEIDALAGFVSSPRGSALYTQYCGECHQEMVQASGNPQELQRVLEEGAAYPPHEDQEIPDWKSALSPSELNALLNFLAAPDGQRLFAINCAGCHGYGVTFTGSEDDLKQLISQGGQHLTMPAWRGMLSDSELETLAAYVTDPSAHPAGAVSFGQHCSACHGETIPSAPDMVAARKIISGGGAHVTMPVWGDILTPEQLDALVQYTLEAGKGGGAQLGAGLYAENCAVCHGSFGEGGPNPAQSGDRISPISSSDFLRTRDDTTLRNIISQGQPDQGMNPFGSAYGGSLEDDEVDALVAFLRSWQDNPPEVAPPAVPTPQPVPPQVGAQAIFAGLCAQCHGLNGEGSTAGPAINTPDLLVKYDDAALEELIRNGIPSTSMIGVGDAFTDRQIQDLVELAKGIASGGAVSSVGDSTYSGGIAPLFQARCQFCHNSGTQLGGWDSTSYDAIMTSGDHAPVIVPGDAEGSLLVGLLRGTAGSPMPPSGSLPEAELQVVIDWIAAGANNN